MLLYSSKQLVKGEAKGIGLIQVYNPLFLFCQKLFWNYRDLPPNLVIRSAMLGIYEV